MIPHRTAPRSQPVARYPKAATGTLTGQASEVGSLRRGHSSFGITVNSGTAQWLAGVERDHPVCPRPGDKPSRPGQAGQDRSSGGALHLDRLGLACSLTGGSTADGMISRQACATTPEEAIKITVQLARVPGGQ